MNGSRQRMLATEDLFRCVCRSGTGWGDGMTEKVVWHVVKTYAKKLEIPKLAPHDLRRSCARSVMLPAANWSKFNFCWGTCPCKRRSATWDVNKDFAKP
jgi:hypothetical protein